MAMRAACISSTDVVALLPKVNGTTSCSRVRPGRHRNTQACIPAARVKCMVPGVYSTTSRLRC
jgi:hypothetical protein